MAEAVLENSHENYKQIQKLFRYFTCATKPNFQILDSLNYALGYHPSHLEIDNCSVAGNHYHIICDKEADFFSVTSTIPCLVNCFHFLLKPTIGVTVAGPILTKLQTAVSVMPKVDPKSFSFNTQQKRLPKLQPISNKITKKTSEDSSSLPAATVKRLKLILEGNFAADFYKLMDVFVSGEGFIDKSTKSFSLKLKLSSTE